MSGEGEGKATRAGGKEQMRTCSGAKNNNAVDREQSFFFLNVCPRHGGM
jgi:hypothetical protein